MRIPETHYASSGELSIGYQVHGSGAHDLLFSGTTASNVETVWSLPEAHRLFERLGRFARVIRFDRRDTGISDPIRDDLTLEAHAADALAVLDAVGAERAVLLGGAEGSRSMAALAATHPERVVSLLAIAPAARGIATEASHIIEEAVRAIVDHNWPGGVVDLWAPDAVDDPAQYDRFARYMRTSMTPRQLRRVIEMSLRSDLSEVLPHVQAPTLVLWPQGSAFPEASSREFARLIPGAIFRPIPGPAIMLYAMDVDRLADVIEEWVTGTAPRPVNSRVLASVLFTDLVGSTARAASLGDRAWTTLLSHHHRDVEETVRQHGGEVIKLLGDGALATFSGPTQAVRCAQVVISQAGHLDLAVRAGVHTGEVERSDNDIAGLAVHVAARISALAEGGEILVSRTVKDLVVGSELRFDARGEHTLKGVPDQWPLFAPTT